MDYLRRLEKTTKKNLLQRIGFLKSGGEDGNRTRLRGFAGRLVVLRIKSLVKNLLKYLLRTLQLNDAQDQYH